MSDQKHDDDESPYKVVVPTILKTKVIKLSSSYTPEECSSKMWTETNSTVVKDQSTAGASSNNHLPLTLLPDIPSEAGDNSDRSRLQGETSNSSFTVSMNTDAKSQKSDDGSARHMTRPHHPEQEPLVDNHKNVSVAVSFSAGNAKLKDIENGGRYDHDMDEGDLIEEENIFTASLALLFLTFDLVWTAGIAYWHIQSDVWVEGALTALIAILSGIVTTAVFWLDRFTPKGKIWKSCKIVWLLTFIPIQLPLLLSAINIIFCIKEHSDSRYRRPWKNTRVIFLTESLALAFPQCVFQLAILLEDPNSIPSLKGYVTIFGICISLMGMAFARIRYDEVGKPGRFGVKWDKYARYVFVWAYKGLWLCMYCILPITMRVMYPEHKVFVSVVSVLSLVVLFEIPVLMSMIPCCEWLGRTTYLGVFFLLPQFTSLSLVILWSNMDPGIYTTYIGCFVLGIYFWVQFAIMTAWLYDSCTGRDSDFMPTYPHFFGDLYATCCVARTASEKPKMNISS